MTTDDRELLRSKQGGPTLKQYWLASTRIAVLRGIIYNVGLMLAHRLRRWANIKPTLSQCSHAPITDVEAMLF